MDIPDTFLLPASERSHPELPGMLRSGTVARLAGLPVTTLRVWERRYGVVSAPKTASGQRQYSHHDVLRLRLLKQLSDGGHAIGTIAALTLPALQTLATGVPAAASSAAARTRSVIVVGRHAAQKLKSFEGCEIQAVHDDLNHGEAAAQAGMQGGAAQSAAADVLLVHLPSLQPSTALQVLALGSSLRAINLVVLYAFGSEAVAESLRAAGATVRREPVTARELGRLIMGTRLAPSSAVAASPPAPRRFSDEALAAVADLPSAVLCECPRHIAEIVMQLLAFEQYSADCTTRSPADSLLHQRLSHLAGGARAQFEQALAQVLKDEGLTLPDHLSASM